MAPTRAIQGQATKLSRTIHGLDYDPVNDEIVAPVYEGGAILVFRGGADGAEAPIRVIQGDRTMMLGPQTATVDPVNDELYVGDPSSGSILVYARDANGNVPPKRVLRGPKTGLRLVLGIAIDTKRNLLVVSNHALVVKSDIARGIYIFNRTDSGDVAPQRVITGVETGIGRSRQIVLDSERGKIYLGVMSTNFAAGRPYIEDQPRKDLIWDRVEKVDSRKPSWSTDTHGFVGVWDINDHGNVAPRAVIKGFSTGLETCFGVDIDPKEGLIMAVGRQMYTTYLVPQFFTEGFWHRKGTEP